jgi:hypothetical protein
MGDMISVITGRQEEFERLFPIPSGSNQVMGRNVSNGPAEPSVEDKMNRIDHDNPESMRLFEINAKAIDCSIPNMKLI